MHITKKKRNNFQIISHEVKCSICAHKEIMAKNIIFEKLKNCNIFSGIVISIGLLAAVCNFYRNFYQYLEFHGNIIINKTEEMEENYLIFLENIFN